MSNKSRNGLTIGLAALIIMGGLVFFLSKGAPISESLATEQPAPVEQQAAAPAPAAAEAPAPTPPAAAEPAKEAEAAPVTAPPAAGGDVDVAAAMKDRILGNADAPVTIIEYASMTCPHCAHFATDILPEFKKRLVETGKVKLIFRDFPLDASALKAAMMSRCAPEDKYFSLIEVIFSNQQRWTTAKDPMEALAQLGALAGIDAARFKACTENKDLETALLGNIQSAQAKYNLTSTPSFVFNDGVEKISGAQPVEKFEEIVGKLTQGK